MAFPALCAGGQSGAANPVKQPVSAGNELYFLRVGVTGVYMASPFVTGSELRRRHGDGGCAGQRA